MERHSSEVGDPIDTLVASWQADLNEIYRQSYNPMVQNAISALSIKMSNDYSTFKRTQRKLITTTATQRRQSNSKHTKTKKWQAVSSHSKATPIILASTKPLFARHITPPNGISNSQSTTKKKKYKLKSTIDTTAGTETTGMSPQSNSQSIVTSCSSAGTQTTGLQEPSSISSQSSGNSGSNTTSITVLSTPHSTFPSKDDEKFNQLLENIPDLLTQCDDVNVLFEQIEQTIAQPTSHQSIATTISTSGSMMDSAQIKDDHKETGSDLENENDDYKIVQELNDIVQDVDDIFQQITDLDSLGEDHDPFINEYLAHDHYSPIAKDPNDDYNTFLAMVQDNPEAFDSDYDSYCGYES